MTDTRVTVTVKIGGETVDVSRLASPPDDSMVFDHASPSEVRRIAAESFESAVTALGYPASTNGKPGSLCDERDCWNPPTRVVSGGFHFCAEHSPKPGDPS